MSQNVEMWKFRHFALMSTFCVGAIIKCTNFLHLALIPMQDEEAGMFCVFNAKFIYLDFEFI